MAAAKMAEAESLRYALRSVGNDLTIEGHHTAGGLMLKLAAFADDECLIRLSSQIKEMADVNG